MDELPLPTLGARNLWEGIQDTPYRNYRDQHPSLSWGFQLYSIRWHMHRMTQAELAKLLGVRQEYISRWERGQLKVPQRIREWVVKALLARLEDGLEPRQPTSWHQPNRNERQQTLMRANGNFGGKGGKRPRKTA